MTSMSLPANIVTASIGTSQGLGIVKIKYQMYALALLDIYHTLAHVSHEQPEMLLYLNIWAECVDGGCNGRVVCICDVQLLHIGHRAIVERRLEGFSSMLIPDRSIDRRCSLGSTQHKSVTCPQYPNVILLLPTKTSCPTGSRAPGWHLACCLAHLPLADQEAARCAKAGGSRMLYRCQRLLSTDMLSGAC